MSNSLTPSKYQRQPARTWPTGPALSTITPAKPPSQSIHHHHHQNSNTPILPVLLCRSVSQPTWPRVCSIAALHTRGFQRQRRLFACSPAFHLLITLPLSPHTPFVSLGAFPKQGLIQNQLGARHGITLDAIEPVPHESLPALSTIPRSLGCFSFLLRDCSACPPDTNGDRLVNSIRNDSSRQYTIVRLRPNDYTGFTLCLLFTRTPHRARAFRSFRPHCRATRGLRRRLGRVLPDCVIIRP